MLKSQDCVLLMKLLVNLDVAWSQRRLATELCMSQSEVHSGLKRLTEAGLVRKNLEQTFPTPVMSAAAEYLVSGLRYSFPVQLGEMTRGVPTGIAAPIFDGKIVLGNDPIPVWPYGKGNAKGVALKPLYRTIPQSIIDHPDQPFYDLLALVDIIRCGRARERNIAIQILKGNLKYEK